MLFDKLIATLKADPRTIVFTEGPDPRILEAASRLKKDGLLTCILVVRSMRSRLRPRPAASISRGWRSLIPPPIPEWTRWWKRWSNCAAAR